MNLSLKMNNQNKIAQLNIYVTFVNYFNTKKKKKNVFKRQDISFKNQNFTFEK